jgi:sugar/nucleoside kinase (ribokinase family)
MGMVRMNIEVSTGTEVLVYTKQQLTHVAFKYMTPKLRLDHEALVDTPLLWSKSFHLICSPLRCIDLVENILRLRQEALGEASSPRPLFIWEPVPDICISSEYDNCLKALQHVDVVSPNHGELGGFFGRDTNGKEHVNYRLIESLCEQWLDSGIGADGRGGVVVRCGKDGCIVTRRGLRKWMPAYHQLADKVVDPTGGGNGFLGALAVGLVRGGKAPGIQNLEEAAIWGSISASFAIEQVGMPALETKGQEETWNGVKVEDRLAEFKKRLDGYVQP